MTQRKEARRPGGTDRRSVNDSGHGEGRRETYRRGSARHCQKVSDLLREPGRLEGEPVGGLAVSAARACGERGEKHQGGD